MKLSSIISQVLDDLKHRIELDLARLAPPLEDVGFNYGFNTDYLKEVGDYWLKKYDWRKAERGLNRFPSFKTRIDGLDVHLIHAKPSPEAARGKKVLPLLLVHGWPGELLLLLLLPLLLLLLLRLLEEASQRYTKNGKA